MVCKRTGQAGFEGVFKIGATIVGIAKDVEISFTRTEIETTTRESAGHKEFIPGHSEFDITTDMLWVADDTGLEALEAAYLAGTLLEFEILDKNGDGYSGCIMISNLTLTQPLDDAVIFSMTAKGTGAPTVLNVTS